MNTIRKRYSIVSVKFLQKVHDEDILKVHVNQLVGTISWNVWNRSHRRFVSCVVLKNSSNTLFHNYVKKIFPVA